MKTIVVKLSVADTGEVAVPLLLQSIPPVTPDNAASPSYGRWLCTSAFIGKRYTGLYYIKNLPVVPCANDEQMWAGKCDLPYNPYAFFFDADDPSDYLNFSRPFMIADSFDPLQRKNGGRGQFHHVFVPGTGFDFSWTPAG